MTEKRSLSIQGHRTSISIEDAFWLELKAMAARRASTLPKLVADIDAARSENTNLSSALRLAVLADTLGRMPSTTSPTSGSERETTTRSGVLFSHVHIGIADFDAAFRFWSAVMAELGVRLRFYEPQAGWAGWQPLESERPLFLIGRPYDRMAPSPGNGPMVAFLGSSRAAVDRAYAAAMNAGGVSEGAPSLRPQYHPHYYGGYFRDLDGNKACVCCHDAPA